MDDNILHGRRILVVEDEYFLAEDLSRQLSSAGCEVIGPAPSAADAAALIAAGDRIDAAVLDVNLRGGLVYPVADALVERGVPFAFATGYDQWIAPDRFAARPWVQKPFRPGSILAVLRPLLVGEAWPGLAAT